MAGVQDRTPPSAAAVAIGTAIISGVTGYFLGQANAIGVFGRSKQDKLADSDEEDADEDVQDLGELQKFPESREECKLVLVVRTDLGMTKGSHHVWGEHMLMSSRKDSSPMLTCHVGMLQDYGKS